ncbi:MAG: Gldg family protein [Bacteroidales bacterium]|nr:Gldg family protein [Bacteroidales bacterium]
MKENRSVIEKKHQVKKINIFFLLISLLIIIFVNIISTYKFFRLDLTAEKRYSLSKATKEMLRNLDDVVFFRVYLEGKFPAGFKKLRNETREILNEFRAYSSNIQYEFINPTRSEDQQETKNIYRLLMEKGLEPTQVYYNEEGGSNTQVIFPGAIVSYKGREVPVQLLNQQLGVNPEMVINNSIQALEYGFAHAIKKLITPLKPKIAFLEGHGELDMYETADISMELSDYYAVRRIKLAYDDPDFQSYVIETGDSAFVSKDTTGIDPNIDTNEVNDVLISNFVKLQFDWLNTFDALIIAKPKFEFNEKDKFMIDQFVMNGGKVLWFIDPVYITMDSLISNPATLAFSLKLNLEDQLFKYGVRINNNLIQDLKSATIPIETGRIANQPQYSYLPWLFFPIIMPEASHPVVKNINALRCEFVSSIDTIAIPNVKKTVLLSSSAYSRALNSPVPVDLSLLRNIPDQRLFNRSYEPIAVLLEGAFESLYKNRLLPPAFLAMAKDIVIKETSVPNKMLVVSDGDIIRNQIRVDERGQIIPLPLGYDRWTRQTFGNKDFVLNAINYLCDDSELIYARSKEFRLRMLDDTKVQKYKLFIQLANVILPILIIIILGLILYFYRRRKFSL